MRRLILLLIAIIFLAGCSVYRIDSQDTTLDFYPPKNTPERVQFLEKVEKPHDIIGIVTVATERSRPMAEVVTKMRYEASVLGGDAITDVRSEPSGILVRHTAKVVVFK
ncbi:MAG: hypothetical protein HQL19_00850 [Candidatus Omnitrophica bacterium]|nr:hypothetical protein [Candidatus Omnitrophota bacterium]